MGIGRPSTYASIIDTILAREYVFKRGTALVPTWTAMAVSQLLESHLPNLVDYQFTAQMEDDLDSISRGEAGHVAYLHNFYFGDGKTGLKPHLESKEGEINARDVSRVRIAQPDGEEPMYVRVGRYGPFVEQGDRRASLPNGLAPDEVTRESALEMLARAQAAEEPLGMCPDTGKPVYLKNRALRALHSAWPGRRSGRKAAERITSQRHDARECRSGDGDKTAHSPARIGVERGQWRGSSGLQRAVWTLCKMRRRDPLSAGRDFAAGCHAGAALELLAQPKAQRRGFGAKREPIKVFEPVSPVTGQKIQLLDGRYGLVCDRRHDECFAADERGGRGPDVRSGPGPVSRASRRGAVTEGGAQESSWPSGGGESCRAQRKGDEEEGGQEKGRRQRCEKEESRREEIGQRRSGRSVRPRRRCTLLNHPLRHHERLAATR